MQIRGLAEGDRIAGRVSFSPHRLAGLCCLAADVRLHRPDVMATEALLDRVEMGQARSAAGRPACGRSMHVSFAAALHLDGRCERLLLFGEGHAVKLLVSRLNWLSSGLLRAGRLNRRLVGFTYRLAGHDFTPVSAMRALDACALRDPTQLADYSQGIKNTIRGRRSRPSEWTAGAAAPPTDASKPRFGAQSVPRGAAIVFGREAWMIRSPAVTRATRATRAMGATGATGVMGRTLRVDTRRGSPSRRWASKRVMSTRSCRRSRAGAWRCRPRRRTSSAC